MVADWNRLEEWLRRVVDLDAELQKSPRSLGSNLVRHLSEAASGD
jgi:hypothetical protein